jgi:hypothetical protein
MSDAFEAAWTLLKSNPRFQAFDLNPITMGTHPDLPRLGRNRPAMNLGTVDPNVMAMAARQGYAARRSLRYPEGIGQGRVSQMMNDTEYGGRYPLTATPTKIGWPQDEVRHMGVEQMEAYPQSNRATVGFEATGSNQISRMPRPHAIRRLPAAGSPQALLDAYRTPETGLAQLEREFGPDRYRDRYPYSPFDTPPEPFDTT